MNVFKESYNRVKDYVLQQSILTWILLGFLITFLFFFVKPLFLDPSHVMQYKQYLISGPIGNDFHFVVNASDTWLNTGVYIANGWPPITTIFLAPFTLVGPQTGYRILLLLIVCAYIFTTLTIPRWINKAPDMSAFAMLIFVTGLVSYGFQFEIERGQFNLIAFAFCLSAIYVFHNHPRFRWLAYILFSIAVQWKLYPAIFVITLIDDWSDWKNNLKRFFALGVINVLALFVLGINPVRDTLAGIAARDTLHLTEYTNHSISSYSYYILRWVALTYKLGIPWYRANTRIALMIQLFLFFLFLVGFVILIRHALRNFEKGYNPYLILACTVGACVFPSLSYDYKLSLLPPAMALALPAIFSFKQSANRLRTIVLVFFFSLAFSSTLYSFANKPPLLQYNFPALFVIFLCTILACVTSNNRRTASIDAEPLHPDDQRIIKDSPSGEPLTMHE